MSKVLIVGTGRSGTGWAAKVLNTAGVRCGHQAVFKHEHTLGRSRIDWGLWEADSSYEAVPHLPVLPDDVRVVHLIRHPLATVKSWLEHGAFGDDMPDRFRDFHAVLKLVRPSILSFTTPVDRAAAYWMWWNMDAAGYADVKMRLEHVSANRLVQACGFDLPVVNVPAADPSIRDKRRRLTQIGWDDITDNDLRWAVRLYAEEWGY